MKVYSCLKKLKLEFEAFLLMLCSRDLQHLSYLTLLNLVMALFYKYFKGFICNHSFKVKVNTQI